MLRTLFIEEARTQLARNAAVTGACCLILLGFLGMWWLLTDVPALAGLMQVASMVVIIAIPVVVMVQVAVEYWQSMYGQRGYLTMTVPVRGRVLFTAKALYACAMALVAGALDLAGLVAWFAVLAHATGTTLGEVLAPLRDALTVGGPGPALATFFIVSSLVGLLTVIVEIGAVMSIGAQGRFNHLDIGAPLIGIVLLYVGNQVLALASTLLLPVSLDITTGDVVARMMLSQFLETFRTGVQPTVIGMGSVVMDDVVVGEGAIVAAGSVVLSKTIIEPYTLWAGVPAKLVKKVSPEQGRELNERIANNYQMYASWFDKEENP